MKKIFLILLVISFFITGCTDEKEVDYKCSFNNVEEKTMEEVIAHFKDDKLQSSIMIVTLDLTDYLQYESIDTYYEKFVQSYKEFSDYDGVDLEIEKGETSIKIKMSVDFNLVSDEVYERLELTPDSSSILSETFIKHYTDNGYTCE